MKSTGESVSELVPANRVRRTKSDARVPIVRMFIWRSLLRRLVGAIGYLSYANGKNVPYVTAESYVDLTAP